MPESAPQGTALRPSHWRQFSLRTLMAFTLLCCVGLVLWSRYIEPARRAQRLIAEVERLGGSSRAEAYDTSWTEVVFGKRYFLEVRDLTLPKARIKDDWLKHVQDAPRLNSLGLSQTDVGDAGLVHLRGLKELESLWLDRTKVTDAGLPHLGHLARLKQLNLQGCQITDDGMGHLEKLNELGELDLRDTLVGDAGIAHLTGLTKLQILRLSNTNVTRASLPHLKQLASLRQVTVAGTGILPSALWYELPKLENPKLTRVLADPTIIEFVETPLQDVADYLQDYHKVDIKLDLRALREVGRDPDIPITRNLRGTPLSIALEQMLKPLGLKCVQWHEVLLITADSPNSVSLPRMILSPDESLSRDLSAALHSPTVMEFVETPLSDVLNYLEDYHRLKFILDKELGDSHPPPVTINLRGISAATALELMLNDLGLHMIQGNVLHVHAGPVPRELLGSQN